MAYKELHRAAEEFLIQRLQKKGHKVSREHAVDHKVLFDVYDATENTAWEVLTAKIVRSGHEQDEAILAKIFRYMMHVPNVKFLLVSFDHEELQMFHDLKLEHWHAHDGWWSFGGPESLKRLYYHRGKTAAQVARDIFNAMVGYAPLKEWIKKGRRKYHPKASVAADFEQITKKLGLPKNFLIGMYRDWRLQWVWKLEQILPLWAEKYKGKRSAPGFESVK